VTPSGVGAYIGNAINQSLFGTDTYRMRPNLTVTIGLRWDYQGVPRDDGQHALNAISSVPGLIDFRKPTSQLTAFSPKLGLAYSPGNSGHTSIRAGFGINYDQTYNNLNINAKPGYFQQTLDVPSLSNNTPNFLAQGGLPPSNTINLPKQANQAADHLISRHLGHP
jgi:hypothetical protein